MRIEARYEKETREALQDVSGNDDDDEGGDDPGDDRPNGGDGRGSAKDRSSEVKMKFGVDDVPNAEEGEGTVSREPDGPVSRASPKTADKEAKKRFSKAKRKESKGAKGDIPMPPGPEPGCRRRSRRDENAIVFQTANAKGGPKWIDVVGRTTIDSETADVLDCIKIDPSKGEDYYRTVIKDGSERTIDTYLW